MLVTKPMSDHLPSSDDGWESARAATRDDVRAVMAPRERRCPACGHVQRSGGRNCEQCEADLTARVAKPRPWKRIVLVAAAVLVIAAAVFPLVSAMRDDAADERAAAGKRQATLEASERARLRADARPVRARGPAAVAGAGALEHRVALVRFGEGKIAADARGRVAAGRLSGDIKGAACHPYPVTEARRAAERSAATRRGRYDCVAYTSKFEAPPQSGRSRTGYFGTPYWLVIDYRRARLVWCKVTPRAGEGGRSLAFVPVPVPCRDPAGPG
jgi:hypothetical protein